MIASSFGWGSYQINGVAWDDAYVSYAVCAVLFAVITLIMTGRR